ncbi:UNVERIFIED_CONTAM: tamm41 [Trichonephila clavipes]
MALSAKILDSIIARFPQRFSLAFAYGSSVFSQGNKNNQKNSIDFIFCVDDPLAWHQANVQANNKHYSMLKYAGADFIKYVQEHFGAKMYFNSLVEVGNRKNMIDFIFCVDDPLAWHQANVQANNKHYSMLKYAGADFIKYVQEHFGAKMYFNSLVEVENRMIKYGIISTTHLIEDLLDWQTLYISGRLHKPVNILTKVENTDVQQALLTNLQSALHASLLCLPENFTEEELYLKIADLSYAGDFRMYFGEDKQKQDGSSATTLHHLNLLPKTVQHNLLVKWNKDGRHRDIEEVLESLAHDPECSDMVKKGNA